MTASIEVARQAEAPGALISRGPGQPQQPRPASRRRDAILIVIMLAAAANLALQQGAIFAIVLAATSGRRLDFIYGRIRQWIGFGPSECPFVRSRRSHRPLPYASPHRRTRAPFRRLGRNAAIQVRLAEDALIVTRAS